MDYTFSIIDDHQPQQTPKQHNFQNKTKIKQKNNTNNNNNNNDNNIDNNNNDNNDKNNFEEINMNYNVMTISWLTCCLLYTSPSPRDQA